MIIRQEIKTKSVQSTYEERKLSVFTDDLINHRENRNLQKQKSNKNKNARN